MAKGLRQPRFAAGNDVFSERSGGMCCDFVLPGVGKTVKPHSYRIFQLLMNNLITVAIFAASALGSSVQAQTVDEFVSIDVFNQSRGAAPATCSDSRLVVHDDGSAELAISGTAGQADAITLVDRFERADFPVPAIDAVCLGWFSIDNSVIDFDFVVFDDDGPGGEPGTELGSISLNTSNLPSSSMQFFSYAVAASGIQLPAEGNFYAGVRYLPPDPNVFFAVDTTGDTNAGAGQLKNGDGGWSSLDSLLDDYSALFVRLLPAGAVSRPVPMLSMTGLVLMSLVLGGLAILSIRALDN